MLHGITPLARLLQLIPTNKSPLVELDVCTRQRTNAPQLQTELLLDIIIVPVILPQLISARFRSSLSAPSKLRKICL